MVDKKKWGKGEDTKIWREYGNVVMVVGRKLFRNSPTNYLSFTNFVEKRIQ